jgi:hypothetical protein
VDLDKQIILLSIPIFIRYLSVPARFNARKRHFSYKNMQVQEEGRKAEEKMTEKLSGGNGKPLGMLASWEQVLIIQRCSSQRFFEEHQLLEF